MNETIESKFWSNVRKSEHDSCWEWTGGLTNCGYGYLYINKKQFLAHRISLLIASGVLDERFVLHSCDNPKCVNPAHLRQGTQYDNIHDALQRRRMLYGEKNGSAKLNASAVEEIRKKKTNGEVQKKLAREYGVCEMTISLIVRNKIWV